jgi:hypothetical protein
MELAAKSGEDRGAPTRLRHLRHAGSIDVVTTQRGRGVVRGSHSYAHLSRLPVLYISQLNALGCCTLVVSADRPSQVRLRTWGGHRRDALARGIHLAVDF